MLDSHWLKFNPIISKHNQFYFLLKNMGFRLVQWIQIYNSRAIIPFIMFYISFVQQKLDSFLKIMAAAVQWVKPFI